MVIDEHLPLGIIANTAVIVGNTLGKKMPEVVGADVTDKTENEHSESHEKVMKKYRTKVRFWSVLFLTYVL